MKKFLTVLLVVAVLFTFSFSAAFAGTVSADEAGMNAVLEQQEAMAKAVNEHVAKFVYTQDGKLFNPANDANVTKVAVDYAVAAIVADYNQAILEKEIELVVDGEFSAADKDALVAVWANIDTYDEFVAVLFGSTYGAKDGALYTKAVEDYAAAFAAKVAAVDASAYADADAVKGIVANAEAALAAKEKSASGLAALVAAEGTFDTAMKAQATVAGQETKLAEKKEAAIKAVQEAADTFYDAEAKRLQDIIDANASPASVAQATADLAVLSGNVDKVEALYVNRINAVAITETVDYAAAESKVETAKAEGVAAMTTDGVKAVIAKYADVDLLVKYAETLTGALKTQYSQTTGLATYNAATVDKALADIIAKIESLDGTADTYAKIQALVNAIPTAAQEKAALSDAVNAGVAAITTGNYALTEWVGDNKDAVKAIQEDYTAKIKAAATADEIDALVKEAKKAMDAYLTEDQQTAVENKVKAFVNKENGVKSALTAYAAGVAAKDAANVYSNATKADAVNQAINVFVDAALALQKADLTDKEIEAIIDANYSAALAKIDAMKTDAALKAEAQAVIDAIKALPTTATLDNKAEFLAAKEMLDAYEKNAGAAVAPVTNKTLLNTQIAKIVRLEREAVEKMIRELPRTITIADKAAVEAARAAVDAYDEAYEDFDAYVAVTNIQTLQAAETALSNAMMTEAAKLIAALPAEITAADKEAVEAARAAYDALSDDDKAIFDRASEALVKKLEAAEKALRIELAYTVESLKITASSKATKGAITVKWTVKGDTAGVEAYEIWKSTKKNSGYSKAFTTTKMSYKNTKGLKKGTRYYYKVRAIAHDAEGKKITSDWSNKAYRIAK